MKKSSIDPPHPARVLRTAQVQQPALKNTPSFQQAWIYQIESPYFITPSV